MTRRALFALAACALLAGCSALPHAGRDPAPVAAPAQAKPAPPAQTAGAPGPRRGGYYKDDGPGDNPPPDLAAIPDAVPRAEPLHRFANRPYEVFGRSYKPLADASNYRQRGRASWYGRRFHGQQTSSGEPYDMYGMTGAHPTLPIPSYVRVTSVATGRSVVVRINDRGPFHPDRVIDLSYTAAAKLGYVEAGSTEVELVTLAPGPVLATATPARTATAPASQSTPVTATAQSAPAEAIPAGVYLQVGAFAGRDNAESFRARVYRDLAWLNDVIRIVPGNSAFRLQVGPYASRSEAQAVADRIRAELNFNPVFITR
jgi:rare lipoprotein A